MQITANLTWERFVLDLELLSAEDPSSLAPLATGLNQILWPEEAQEQTLRNVNFMCYELMSRCQDMEEADRLQELNEYFFNKKGFQISSSTAEDTWSENDLLLKSILQNKSGAPIGVALIYLHLASHLDLPVYLVHFRNHCVVKWVRAGKSCFMDLTGGGLQLSQEQILEMVSLNSRQVCSHESLEILPSKSIFLKYAEELSEHYGRIKDIPRLHTLINTRLIIDPNNLELLGERALLRQRLGFVKEAIQDLKRYFSFVDHDHAPLELQSAFHQLQGVSDFGQRNGMDFLH